MLKSLRPALVLTGLFTLLLGLGYPLALTGLSGVLFPVQAQGSLISRDGTVIGSELIGQNFTADRYFWPRPSATAPTPYNAAASTGSNLGPTSAALVTRVGQDIARLRAAGIEGPVPADAATASGSGLDPDISPDFALAQLARVAKARGVPEGEVRALVEAQTVPRLFGVIGEPRVNVLRLNLALDAARG